MNLKTSYKIVFTDLDDTLIETISGETFPKGVYDMRIKFDVLDKIKQLNPEYLFIVTNQGGIGKFVNLERFENKVAYVASSIKEYCEIPNVDWTYCSSGDKKDKYRKPNTGMFDTITLSNHLFLNKDFTLADCLMIGDASGKPGDFSDSDKRFAENCQINYIDVDDLLNI